MTYNCNSDIKIFACNSNKDLAEKIAKDLGLTVGDSEVEKFSDGEIFVKINETNDLHNYSHFGIISL